MRRAFHSLVIAFVVSWKYVVLAGGWTDFWYDRPPGKETIQVIAFFDTRPEAEAFVKTAPPWAFEVELKEL